MTDTPETVATRASQRSQNRFDTAAQCQVGVRHQAGAYFGSTVESAGAHGRDAVHELHLADGPHFDGPLGAVHRGCLHGHRGDDIVAAVCIDQQIVQQIPPSRALPQMVMRIDDG